MPKKRTFCENYITKSPLSVDMWFLSIYKEVLLNAISTNES